MTSDITRPLFYYLDDKKNPKPATREEYDLVESSLLNNPLKRTQLSNCTVSTAFLSVDHAFNPQHQPLLFETMIFEDVDYDRLTQERFASYEEAILFHDKLVKSRTQSQSH